MKKALKIAGIILLLLVLALFAIPFFFQDVIKEKIVAAINKNVDATVSFEDADLRLFRSFAQANVKLEKLLIVNKAPFAGDTLISFGTLALDMSVRELFKGKDEPMEIKSIATRDGLINILFNKDGLGNFDIALKNAEEKNAGESQPLSLKIKEYNIENFTFRYADERSKMRMSIDSLYHSGSGDFAQSKLDLVTKTAGRVSFTMDQANYMNRVPVALDATLGIDLEASKYSFKQNTALINKLPLEFDGFIQLLENGQQFDLTFATASSSFTNFLALVPSAYAGSLDKVKTQGNFTIKGVAKGIYSETTVPKFNIAIASNDASFQFPDLPKAVRNIVIDAKIINDSGVLNDTYVNLDQLSFAIDQDVFSARANIKNVVENPLVDAALKGSINLANVSKAYPLKLDTPLSGILKADVVTRFDMASVEKSQYEKIYNAGSMSVSNFKYTPDGGKPFNISVAALKFNPSRVDLQQFAATTGKSDLNLTGRLDNVYGFAFNNQNLKGNFNMQSNQIAVADFMTSSAPADAKSKTAEPVKIPAFLDCTIAARANTVLYDNLVLRNVSGTLVVRDQTAELKQMKTNIFGGAIGLNGQVSTKAKVPTFDMDLSMNAVDIAQTFTQLDMMRNIAPIAGVINGKLNSTINVKGNLNATEMTPVLNTLSGDLKGQFLSTTVNPTTSGLLSKLDNSLSFIDLQKFNLNDVRAALSFQNGKVNLKPVDVRYKDIKLQFNGQHGFDQTMAYNVKFDVPAKYLGNEVNNLLSRLTPADAARIDNVPVNAAVTGTFANPRVSTDVKSAVGNLTNQLVQAQKQQVINKGKNALNNIINNATRKDTAKTQSGTKPNVREQAGNALKDLFGKRKKQESGTAQPK